MESWIFLAVILLIAALGKNESLLIASVVIMALKLLWHFLPQIEKFFELLSAKGINWGVTLISITILVPIATGRIGLKDLVNAFRSPIGWIAIICGIFVAVLSARGVNLIAQSPEVTVALVLGTIIGVVVLKGVAAGPVIAAGMTYFLFSCFQFFFK